jgi:head-tail adaptor
MKLTDLHKLDQRITFQRFAKIKTRAGGYEDERDNADAWENVKTVSARLHVSGADQIVYGDEPLSTATHVFEIMQSITGIDDTMRILWKGKTMKILDIVPDYDDFNIQVITAVYKEFRSS